MQKFFIYCVLHFSFLFILTSAVSAQTKDDLVAGLSLILELPDMEDVYQNDVSGGKVAILLRTPPSIQPINKLLRDIETDDFSDLYHSVEVWETNDLQQQNIPAEYTLRYSISYQEEEQTMEIQMWTELNEDRRITLQGLFKLFKNDEEEWALLTHSVERVPSRTAPVSTRRN